MTLTPARPGDRSVVGSISFEHFADRYDATRGGLERGRALARGVGGRLGPGPGLGLTACEPFAARYDATRGGLERGRALARVIGGRLVPGPVLEVGVGTGAVARPRVGRAHRVGGAAPARAMLRPPGGPLAPGGGVAAGSRLPVAGGALANV